MQFTDSKIMMQKEIENLKSFIVDEKLAESLPRYKIYNQALKDQIKILENNIKKLEKMETQIKNFEKSFFGM